MAKEDFELVLICETNDPDVAEKKQAAVHTPGIVMMTVKDKKWYALVSKDLAGE